jgi:hypothetical protein
MMSRISIHLKKQHGQGYDPDDTDDVETNEQKIPPLPSVPLITTGFIENTRDFNTKTHNMPVTSGRGLQERPVDGDDELNLRPSNTPSTLTAVSMQKEGTRIDPRALNHFEEMGKMESGTYKSES